MLIKIYFHIMSIISKILILLGLMIVTLEKRCDFCIWHTDDNNCYDYLECHITKHGFVDNECMPTKKWDECCAKDKDGHYCAKVQKGTKLPVCFEADEDNLCESSEFEFLE
jgi:hypothetical protein